MKVTVDRNGGFCWGVVRAIDFAEEELANSNKLYSLGDIIHNPSEIERLNEKGLQTISHKDLENIKDAKVLIRAHGEPPSTYEIARKYNLEIIDATCPVVTKLQERIRKFHDDGYQVVIFGKKDHAEVIGLRGVCNDEAIVVKSVEEALLQVNFNRKTVLFSQTTMDKPTFYAIKDALSRKIKDLVVGTMEDIAKNFLAKDTICGQVSGRDKKLREFAAQNDVIVFVAGKSSSNGKVLFEICKEENKSSYFIEDESELQASWFENAETVGVTGATSTPQWLMEKVKDAVLNLELAVNDTR
ncbi:MAG TPA: 4-hydroxy-3-methylbut-2-enyl diphosphate reductase [Candidatus Acidoferrales bacterium]|nr:4-hydroxy-3-methylbut-2-enyl diphosphate reductase [Candidatus Acidoferrales bacterium]